MSEFRQSMLSDSRISHLVDFKNSEDCFPGVNVAGGICYFLWEKDYRGDCNVKNVYSVRGIAKEDVAQRRLNEYDILVRDNAAIRIIRKIKSLNTKMLNSEVKSYSYFAIRSFERGISTQTNANDVYLLSSQGKGYYPKNKIIDRDSILQKYKVIITYAMSGGNKPSSDGNYQVISSLQILKPNEVCTETYLILGVFDDIVSSQNMISYVQTKFFRFLLLQSLTSIHITKDSFQFVPCQDYTATWTDEDLYKKYNLTEEEIELIDSTIKPMDVNGGDDNG